MTRNIRTGKQAEMRMREVSEEIRSSRGENMNSLLAPEPVALDGEKLTAEIRFVKEKLGNERKGRDTRRSHIGPCSIRLWE